jgi:hypothetical protein
MQGANASCAVLEHLAAVCNATACLGHIVVPRALTLQSLSVWLLK